MLVLDPPMISFSLIYGFSQCIIDENRSELYFPLELTSIT